MPSLDAAGRPVSLTSAVICSRCGFSAHGACCFPEVPTLHRCAQWRCEVCMSCESCGYKEAEWAEYDKWDATFTKCLPCYKAFQDGEYCCLCNTAWKDQTLMTTQGIRCEGCKLTVHQFCDPTSNTINYRCPVCRGNNQQERFLRALDQLMVADKAKSFSFPVPRTIINYWRVVKHPMNFSEMKVKVLRNDYKDIKAFFSDFNLIIHNAKIVHMPKTKLYRLASALEKRGWELLAGILGGGPSRKEVQERAAQLASQCTVPFLMDADQCFELTKVAKESLSNLEVTSQKKMSKNQQQKKESDKPALPTSKGFEILMNNHPSSLERSVLKCISCNSNSDAFMVCTKCCRLWHQICGCLVIQSLPFMISDCTLTSFLCLECSNHLICARCHTREASSTLCLACQEILQSNQVPLEDAYLCERISRLFKEAEEDGIDHAWSYQVSNAPGPRLVCSTCSRMCPAWSFSDDLKDLSVPLSSLQVRCPSCGSNDQVPAPPQKVKDLEAATSTLRNKVAQTQQCIDILLAGWCPVAADRPLLKSALERDAALGLQLITLLSATSITREEVNEFVRKLWDRGRGLTAAESIPDPVVNHSHHFDLLVQCWRSFLEGMLSFDTDPSTGVCRLCLRGPCCWLGYQVHLGSDWVHAQCLVWSLKLPPPPTCFSVVSTAAVKVRVDAESLKVDLEQGTGGVCKGGCGKIGGLFVRGIAYHLPCLLLSSEGPSHFEQVWSSLFFPVKKWYSGGVAAIVRSLIRYHSIEVFEREIKVPKNIERFVKNLFPINFNEEIAGVTNSPFYDQSNFLLTEELEFDKEVKSFSCLRVFWDFQKPQALAIYLCKSRPSHFSIFINRESQWQVISESDTAESCLQKLSFEMEANVFFGFKSPQLKKLAQLYKQYFDIYQSLNAHSELTSTKVTNLLRTQRAALWEFVSPSRTHPTTELGHAKHFFDNNSLQSHTPASPSSWNRMIDLYDLCVFSAPQGTPALPYFPLLGASPSSSPITPAQPPREKRTGLRSQQQQPPQQQQMTLRASTRQGDSPTGKSFRFDKLPSSVQYKQLLSINPESRVQAKLSPIHGLGLFATSKIPQGDPVVEYIGDVIRNVIADKREKYYESLGSSDASCYMFRLNRNYVVDAALAGNVARFINHCCEPNCFCRVIAAENDHIVIFANRDIEENEEITYDYKVESGAALRYFFFSSTLKKNPLK